MGTTTHRLREMGMRGMGYQKIVHNSLTSLGDGPLFADFPSVQGIELSKHENRDKSGPSMIMSDGMF